MGPAAGIPRDCQGLYGRAAVGTGEIPTELPGVAVRGDRLADPGCHQRHPGDRVGSADPVATGHAGPLPGGDDMTDCQGYLLLCSICHGGARAYRSGPQFCRVHIDCRGSWGTSSARHASTGTSTAGRQRHGSQLRHIRPDFVVRMLYLPFLT